MSILKYKNESSADKEKRVKVIQQELGLNQTGQWDKQTNDKYKDLMSKRDVDAFSLSEFIKGKSLKSKLPQSSFKLDKSQPIAKKQEQVIPKEKSVLDSIFDLGNKAKNYISDSLKETQKPQEIEEGSDDITEDISGLLSGATRFFERASATDEDQKITPVVKKETKLSILPKKENTPTIKESYELLGTAKDKSGKLHSFRRTFDNDIGGRMIPLPKMKELGNKDTVLRNVSGVGHFIMDGDITPNQKYLKLYKTSKGQTVTSNYTDMFLNTDVSKPDSYVAQYKPEPNGEYRVRYKQLKDIKGVDFGKKDYTDYEGYETKLGVRSHKFTDVDWDNSGKSTGYQISSNYVPTKDKNKSTSIVTTGKDNYSRFGGGSVTYLFKDKNGKSIGIDVSGSPSTLKEQGLNIIKEYGIKPEDLSFTYHDMGSYSAKPMANEKGELSSSQWRDYNQYNKGYSGAALVFPKYKKGGYLKDKNTYVTKDGKETKRGLWANVYLKSKHQRGGIFLYQTGGLTKPKSLQEAEKKMTDTWSKSTVKPKKYELPQQEEINVPQFIGNAVVGMIEPGATIKDVYDLTQSKTKADLLGGTIGMILPGVSGKAISQSMNLPVVKPTFDTINMTSNQRTKLFQKYGMNYYNKWKKDGQPDIF